MEKAESVIELWEEYEVEVPVDSGEANSTVEVGETLESSADETEEVGSHSMLPTASTVHVTCPAALI